MLTSVVYALSFVLFSLIICDKNSDYSFFNSVFTFFAAHSIIGNFTTGLATRIKNRFAFTVEDIKMLVH